jgi:hypothetical protein
MHETHRTGKFLAAIMQEQQMIRDTIELILLHPVRKLVLILESQLFTIDFVANPERFSTQRFRIRQPNAEVLFETIYDFVH